MQLALNDELGFPGAAMLLALKMVVILAVLRGGAEGGLLTPGLAVGGMTSLLLCMLWQQLLPGEIAPVLLSSARRRSSLHPCKCR